MRNKFLWFALVTLFVLGVWFWRESYALNSSAKIYFFDIGQGDAALIKLGTTDILIDGGPSAEVLNKLGEHLGFFDRKIELVILTHPDQDHVAGLPEILERYEVGAFLGTFVSDDNLAYAGLLGKVESKKIPQIDAKAGLRIWLGRGIWMDVLYPGRYLRGETFTNANKSSVVLRLVTPKEDFLLTGDLETPEEYEILAAAFDLSADVLKVGHHGSRSSSAESFLKAVGAKKAVISAGRNNRYGHPHGEILERLAASGMEILRTDILGDIEFSLN